MGNGIGKCFSGDAGEISRRRHDIAISLTCPLDEGLGHSFCYIRPDPPSKTAFSDQPTTQSAAVSTFRTISGASISANASTPLSTALLDVGTYGDKASAFESSNLFSSIPLQPIPRDSISSIRSGPIPRVSGQGSGSIERGFMSGPIERSFISGPLENHQYDQFQRYKPRSRKWGSLNSFKKVLLKSFWSSKDLSFHEKHHHNGMFSSGTINSISNSNTLSSQASLVDDDDDEEDDDGHNESFGSQNVQWAQGKSGEDRVHIVISEEHGWVFVGIYDGFNGPDATDFLLKNLYSNLHKELKGLLWTDNKFDLFENSESNQSTWSSSDLDLMNKDEFHMKLRENLKRLRADSVDHHSEVLKALSEALRKTEESYLEIADMMLQENPELALMGSCVLAMLMKGEDVYLMNVGDSRAVLAQRVLDSDQLNVNVAESFGDMFKSLHNFTSCQITSDHCTETKEEVRRIRREHPDDVFAVVNDRVKGSLKVTRAFGAGFLKQPKWNEALLEMFRIDYVGTSPYITCSPDLFHHRLGPRDKFLILSSDGLYQYFNNEEAISEVESFLSTFPEGDPAQHLVEEVLFRAAKKAGMDFHQLLDIPQGDRRKYHDDVSVIIISFEGRIWKSSV